MSPQPITIIKSHERTVHAVECQLCPRDAMDMSLSGVVTWKSAHGNQPHPNVTTIQTLLKWSFSVLSVATLKDLRRMLDEQIAKAA